MAIVMYNKKWTESKLNSLYSCTGVLVNERTEEKCNSEDQTFKTKPYIVKVKPENTWQRNVYTTADWTTYLLLWYFIDSN